MVIPDLAKKITNAAYFDYRNQQKKAWLNERKAAVDYYNGMTEQYTGKYYPDGFAQKTPFANINITRRVIDRISLVYMIPPLRIIGKEKAPQSRYDEFTSHQKTKMQRAEAMSNLLGMVPLRIVWRYGWVDYDIIYDFEPIFGDDPMRPEAITFPVKTRDSVLITDPEIWAYWDTGGWFHYIKATGQKVPSINAIGDAKIEHENPYKVLPFVWCYRDVPEKSFLDVSVAGDLIQSNLRINVFETDKGANIRFQSFGHEWITGVSQEDAALIKVGPDEVTMLPDGAQMGMNTPPDTSISITEAIKNEYKLLARNYHLPEDFVGGSTQAESGVALKIRNQELNEDRKSDVERWRAVEEEKYQIERKIINVEGGVALPEEFRVDFAESVSILTTQEKREKDEWELNRGIITVPEIMLRDDPDKYRDLNAAMEAYENNISIKNKLENKGEQNGTLSDLLNA